MAAAAGAASWSAWVLSAEGGRELGLKRSGAARLRFGKRSRPLLSTPLPWVSAMASTAAAAFAALPLLVPPLLTVVTVQP
jgi:hypothetical protein